MLAGESPGILWKMFPAYKNSITRFIDINDDKSLQAYIKSKVRRPQSLQVRYVIARSSTVRAKEKFSKDFLGTKAWI